MEIVTIRVMGLGRLNRPPEADYQATLDTPTRKKTHRRLVVFGSKRLMSSVVQRGAIRNHSVIKGPAIIEEPTATTIVPPGWRVSLTTGGHLAIRKV